MYDILMWIAHALPFYRAAQDAGIWFFQLDTEVREAYMESYFITKGML